jgi:hypothetical protein
MRNATARANLAEAARIYEIREAKREAGLPYEHLDIGIRILRELAARQEAANSLQGSLDFGLQDEDKPATKG